MHYDGTLRGILPIPILTDKITGQSIKINKKMSPMDIKKLNQMYPCAKPRAPNCGKLIKMLLQVRVPAARPLLPIFTFN